MDMNTTMQTQSETGRGFRAYLAFRRANRRDYWALRRPTRSYLRRQLVYLNSCAPDQQGLAWRLASMLELARQGEAGGLDPETSFSDDERGLAEGLRRRIGPAGVRERLARLFCFLSFSLLYALLPALGALLLSENPAQAFLRGRLALNLPALFIYTGAFWLFWLVSGRVWAFRLPSWGIYVFRYLELFVSWPLLFLGSARLLPNFALLLPIWTLIFVPPALAGLSFALRLFCAGRAFTRA